MSLVCGKGVQHRGPWAYQIDAKASPGQCTIDHHPSAHYVEPRTEEDMRALPSPGSSGPYHMYRHPSQRPPRCDMSTGGRTAVLYLGPPPFKRAQENALYESLIKQTGDREEIGFPVCFTLQPPDYS